MLAPRKRWLATIAPFSLTGRRCVAAKRHAGSDSPHREYLLRLPYGTATDPIESFAFEEFTGEPQHEHLLWGNASLATALLLGRGFTTRGWDMEPGDERELDDLPAYTFVRDGASEMQACAEHFLTESQIHALLKAGLIPIASRRDRNAAVAVRFQSISDPPAPLAW